MPYRDLEPISKQLTIVIGLTVVGFMAFGLALSFYRNILFEDTLLNIAGQNQKLKDKIGEGQADLEYFQSAQFKDKYAKENLGKVNHGEKVFVITRREQPVIPAPGDALSDRERHRVAYEEYMRELPVIEHWKMYLFHRERIEELKKEL